MFKPLLREIIEEQAAIRAGHNFLAFGESEFSYAETNSRATRVARVFLELGLKPGDRVAFFLPNRPEFIFSWFATIKLNLVLIPLNINLKGEALRFLLSHAEPQAVLTTAHLLPKLGAVAGTLTLPWQVIVVDGDEAAGSPGLIEKAGKSFKRVNSFESLIKQAPPTFLPEFRVNDEDTGMIIYTSGTTGHPKGVMINRRAQTNHALYYQAEMLGTAPDEVAYTYLPLFHVTSQGVTMGSFLGGSRLALEPEFKVFGFWERLRRYNARVFPYLGAVLSMLYARPPQPDDALNPVTHAIGAAAPKEIWAAFERRFNLRLVETYGQSEWMSIWTMHPGNISRIGSAGKAPARAEIKIVDRDNRELPPGKAGEIIMRPKEPGLMMSGYYRQPELNARVFKEGWYFTGDMGELDEDGYLYFRGRLKDYIRRRGENISAFEIERIVNCHPAVLESAAVGVPSRLSEEEVKLCLVLKPEGKATPEEIWSYCKAELPAFMVPRYIEILPELPHTATQRIRKFLLAEKSLTGAWDRKARKTEI